MVLATMVTTWWMAAGAAAHVELLEADPAPGGTLEQGADSISLTFVSLSLRHPVQVAVLDDTGTDRAAGPPTVRPPDQGTEVVVPIEALALGTHTVEWTAVGDDGDVSEGSYTFTVVERTGAGATWVLWVGALLVVVAVTAGLMRSARRRR